MARWRTTCCESSRDNDAEQMKKIVVTLAIPEPGLEILHGAGTVIVRPSSELLDEEGLVALIDDADAVVTMLTDPVTERVLESCSELKVIGNFAVGTNNIDLTAAARLGVWVTNTPGVLTEATADLAMALILAVTRRVVESDRLLRAGGFKRWAPDFMLGQSLQGKRLGILGLGRIGTEVGLRAEAFGMEVCYTSRSSKPEAARRGWKRLDPRELLRTSHVVSVHTPLTNHTKHLIGAKALSEMRPDAVLVNTSRGEVVDEGALAAALRGGRIRGAGLDVFENEPEVHPELLALENVVLLPHIGSATLETRSEMSRIVTTDVSRVLNGEAPLHAVVTPSSPRQ